MNDDPYFEIMSELLSLECSKGNTYSKEIAIKCRFCDDYIKPNKPPHLYIGRVESNKGSALLYHCKKCEVSGKITKGFLRKYNIELTPNIIKSLKNTNSVKSSNSIIENKNISNNTDYKLVPLGNVKKHKEKINYLENRFGFKIDNDYIKRMNIVLDLNEFLIYNNLLEDILIEKKEVKNISNLLENISNNYVGFLTADKNYIIFRNCNPLDTGQRYYNFQLSRKISKYFYVIGSNLNILTDIPRIVLAEGIFDIIGVYNRYGIEDSDNTIYAGVCGKSNYLSVLKNIITKTAFNDANIIIYADKDTDLDYFKKTFYEFKDFNKFIIYYNKNGKDFGENEDIEIEKFNLY